MLLLDTDVMVDVLRGYEPALAWLASVPDASIALPGFVAMELIQGCQDQEERDLLLRELERFHILWPDEETCRRALNTFSRVHLSHGTGLLDALIGQMGADLGVPLHSFNEKHYTPLPGLEVKQPYERT